VACYKGYSFIEVFKDEVDIALNFVMIDVSWTEKILEQNGRGQLDILFF
jgi:hypothetical protein